MPDGKCAIARPDTDSGTESGNLEGTAKFGSQKSKTNVPVSPQEQEKAQKEMKLYLEQEKPVFTISSIVIKGTRAIVKMEVSIQLPNGSREKGEVYDLWVFEIGDWYIRDGGKTRPETLLKD